MSSHKLFKYQFVGKHGPTYDPLQIGTHPIRYSSNCNSPLWIKKPVFFISFFDIWGLKINIFNDLITLLLEASITHASFPTYPP